MEKLIAYTVVFIIAVIVGSILLGAIVIVNAGERGVHKEWGRVTGIVFGEGLHFIIPIANSVDIIDVKTLKIVTQASAASKDLQDVTSTIALNYKVNVNQVANLRQNIGMDYRAKIIDPAIQEAIKASTAKFTAEELITKRAEARQLMEKTLQEKIAGMSENSIIVVAFNIENFEFSRAFSDAIEAKVTAEQLALKAERDLERVKMEAQQKIEQAKAEAESIRIQSEALKENPDILQLRWIEKWNGMLPTYLGGGEGIIFSIPSQ